MQTKLLLVVNVPWFFISHRLPVALAAKLRGYDVHIATSSGPEVEQIREKGFVVHEISFSRSSITPINEIKTLFSLFKLYKGLKPDIVHHVTIKPVLYGSFVAHLTNVTHVVNAISGLGFVFISTGLVAKLRRQLVEKAYRYVLHKQNVVAIFQNPDDQNSFIDAGILEKNKTIIIRGSGVDLESFSSVSEPAGQLVVVLAARMLWDKGIGEFVEAARLIKSKKRDVIFRLVGDIDEGNPKAIDRKQIELWCDEDVIEWSGFSSNISKLFSESHIICLPSYREGLPKVLIEAAASGRAVITTDVPGCRHAIEPDVTGLLVPVRNAPALAEAINRLLDNPSLRLEMGRAGRKLAEKEFSIHKVVDAHMQVYEDLLNL